MKLCILGIDGGDFSILDPLFRKGRLPHLHSLVNTGYSARLISTVPPVTAPAWVSFMTGVNPGKHGLFDFFTAVENSYFRPFSSYLDIKTRTIWKILTDSGFKVGLINVPLTYPPEEVNGFVIPGMQYSMTGGGFTHPPELADKLGPDYRVGAEYDGSLERFVEDLKTVIRERTALVRRLISEYELDVFMIVFKATDVAQHFFWRFYDDSHPAHDPVLAQKFGNVIPDIYREVDEAIGNLFDILPGSPAYAVLSDHGTGPQIRDFLVNRWLIREGYLTPRRILEPLWRFRYPRLFWRLLHRMRVPGISAQPGAHWEKEVRDLIDPRQALYHDMLIDWKNTRAYFGNMTEQGIYLNVKGRQPSGIVNPGAEYERLRDEISEKLLAYRDVESGHPVVQDVYRSENIYSGPWTDKAPDLVIHPDEKGYLGHKYFYPKDVCVDSVRISGTHRMEGIFFLKGDGVTPGRRIENPEIIDVAPTLLYLLGLPVPEEMDGRVINEAFSENYLESNPVRTIQSEKTCKGKSAADGEDVYSRDDVEKMSEHLKGLGYI